MRRRSDTLREDRRYEPIFDEKGFPREKTQNEIGEAIEVSVFVPWGAWWTLSTRSTHLFSVLSFTKQSLSSAFRIKLSILTITFLGCSISFSSQRDNLWKRGTQTKLNKSKEFPPFLYFYTLLNREILIFGKVLITRKLR